MVSGKVFKYGDNVDTDVIIPARYLNAPSPEELAKHCMEDIDASFATTVKPGDIMVGGANFGCGSSREHAPISIRACGVRCVIAASFARIFYRNSFNMGLMLLEVGDEVEKIKDGDQLEISPETGVIRNLTTGDEIRIPVLSSMMQTLIDKGGMVNYVKEQLKEMGE